MHYNKIDTNLFINNRKQLAKHLKPNALAILNSNDIMPKNTDGVMPFFQNSDLFYLSGIEQTETVLVLYPDASNPQHQELLFLKETNEQLGTWNGECYDKKTATAISGVQEIRWLSSFEEILHELMGRATYVYLNTNEHYRAFTHVPTRDMRFIHWCQNRYPLHTYERLAPIMQQLRVVKSASEVKLIQQACTITEQGFRNILPIIKPGIIEYEIEGALSHEFIRRGSRGFAYPPIIASGKNACILHYNKNNQVCKDDDLILLDIGAEYANYSADLTRVVPVNGRFTKRQRDVYNAVLRVMNAAKQLLVPGNTIPTYNKEVAKIMEEELISLGLLDTIDIKKQNPDNPVYRKYFMHGTSHHLGLETHDLGDIYQLLTPNMVVTIEPGIYIREEDIGIRLENDVVIRENGIEDLMSSIPIEIEAIEALMNP